MGWQPIELGRNSTYQADPERGKNLDRCVSVQPVRGFSIGTVSNLRHMYEELAGHEYRDQVSQKYVIFGSLINRIAASS